MRRLFLYLLLALLAASFVWPLRLQAQATPQPVDCTTPAAPTDQGLDAALLAKIPQEIAEAQMAYVYSVLVARHGLIVYEAYFNGYLAEQRDNIRSVTKSVTSALVGIALARGDLSGLDVTLADAFPEYFVDRANAEKRNITLRQLLRMRSGLAWGEANWQVIALWESGLDQMRRLIKLPLAHLPGEVFHYSTADAHLAGGILTRSLGQSLLEYANAHLFGPLGIVGAEWPVDATGFNVGGATLRLTPREMLKFGCLYLQHGIWHGQRVIPAEWIALTTAPQDEQIHYGYQWWRGEHPFFGGYDAFIALGYGGDMIFVDPAYDLVIVIKAEYEVQSTTASQQETAIMALVQDYILAAVKDIKPQQPHQ